MKCTTTGTELRCGFTRDSSALYSPHGNVEKYLGQYGCNAQDEQGCETVYCPLWKRKMKGGDGKGKRNGKENRKESEKKNEKKKKRGKREKEKGREGSYLQLKCKDAVKVSSRHTAHLSNTSPTHPPAPSVSITLFVELQQLLCTGISELHAAAKLIRGSINACSFFSAPFATSTVTEVL